MWARSYLKNMLLPIFEPFQASLARRRRGLRVAPEACADALASDRAIRGATRSHPKSVFELASRVWLAVVLCLCGCREEIVHDLREDEANRVLGVLQESLIDARKEKQPDGMWSIGVPAKKVTDSLRYLHKSRVLRRTEVGKKTGASVMSSREDQLFSHERALSREIETTLLGIEGVLDARVHLHLIPTDPVFGRPLPGAKSGTGSVLLIAATDIGIEKEQVGELVAGASGLSAETISVLITPVQFVSEKLNRPAPVSDSSHQDEVVEKDQEMSSLVREHSTISIGIASVLLLLGCWQMARLFGIRAGG